jgi:hypothetical protein
MSNTLGMAILPDFLEFTGAHTYTSRSTLKWPIQDLPLQKSWGIWKKLVCKQFLLSKLGQLGMATLETPLQLFIQTHNNIRCGTGNKPEPTPLLKTRTCSTFTNKSTTKPYKQDIR